MGYYLHAWSYCQDITFVNANLLCFLEWELHQIIMCRCVFISSHQCTGLFCLIAITSQTKRIKKMSTTRLHCLFYNYNASLIIAPIVHWWLENWVHNWGTSQNLNTTAWDARQNVSRDLQKSTNVTLKVCGSYKKKPFPALSYDMPSLGKKT